MAEKRVSVRLAAVGGRQVRAELEGVGEAGTRGFGRLSREMEAANKRLAGFARGITVAMSAAAAAAIPAMGAIARATIQAAAETRELAQVANATPEAFQRWAGAARSVGIEEEKLADVLKDVNDRVGDFLQTGGGPMADFFENVAPKVGVTADQFARLSGPEALKLFVDSLERAGLSQQEMTFYLEAMASDVTRLLPLLRNGGAEMQRLGARASDLGAVMDASTIETMRRAQIALIGVGQVFEGMRNQIGAALAPAMIRLSNAFIRLSSSGGMLHSAFHGLIDNLDRLATYAATFVAYLTGRWVAGFAAAAFSVRGLATALVLLRGALIRTGIGALIIGVGELIYQFGQLVRGAGGLGNAFQLMGGVAKAVWNGIKASAGSFADDFRALRAEVESIWLRLMSFLSRKWADFLGQIGPTFNAVAQTIGADARVDWFGAQSYASRLGHAASNAGASAEVFRRQAIATRASAFDGVGPAMQALRDAMRGGNDIGADALTEATRATERFETALGDAGSAATGAGTATKAAAEAAKPTSEAAATGWQAVTAALSNYAGRARAVGDDIGKSLVGAFQGAENAVADFVKSGKLKVRDLVTSLIADLAKLAARRFILAPLSNAVSGIFGGMADPWASLRAVTMHSGGIAGRDGTARMVPTLAFAGAPRMHSGGSVGLRHDEVPAILQRGERVLSRRETRDYGTASSTPAVNITIMTRDAESFRQSRTQVAADIARAVSLGRRGL
ncbi:phage tail tape measure C-terminal domain-containing protein [Pararhizobium haloflavum]|uniref:phage tail tape measure C-terminal domain-containing protein n=1 Tax=Pararhizobium haloflavum TaxID=2037914 RepID=UPI000C1A6B8C|nr:phage tail tape measure C-terminal domain-containing protein [Pararhizobium haloflavum]